MGVSVPDPMFLLGGLCPWGLSLGVSVQRGSLSRGFSVQKERMSLSRGSLSGVSVQESEKRAVRILLECLRYSLLMDLIETTPILVPGLIQVRI